MFHKLIWRNMILTITISKWKQMVLKICNNLFLNLINLIHINLTRKNSKNKISQNHMKISKSLPLKKGYMFINQKFNKTKTVTYINNLFNNETKIKNLTKIICFNLVNRANCLIMILSSFKL